ncbi:thiamine pyrophosphate-dependent enzyme, partial [uncultured Pigmentiphaga sp.]|uniref:thiamine pyrophosphate-dependent enzyme n=1 Tax=uncultured Pigmentiphaga sp. TaxID=340361 RepID=UPI00261FB112
ATGQLARAGQGQGGYDAWREEVRAAVEYRPPEWQSAGQIAGKGIHPAALFRPVQELLDSHPDSVLVCDGGECGQWAQACLRAGHRMVNGVAGAIGGALPMALGARCVYPDAPIVAVMGDGTFGFHCAEIDTGVRYGLPFVCLVANDARWNAEYQIQLNTYGKDRTVGCELLPTRYEKVAQGFGAQGAYVDDLAALPAALKQAAAERRVPFCLNVTLEGLPAPLVRR